MGHFPNILKTFDAIDQSLYQILSIYNHFRKKTLTFEVNETRYKQCGVTPHFSKEQAPLKKIWEKVNIGTIIREKDFYRSAEHK